MASPKHEAPPQPQTLTTRLRGTFASRTLWLGIGALVLQLAFMLTYIGAVQSPSPTRFPVMVVAPKQLAAQVADELNALPGEPLIARAGDHVRAGPPAVRPGQLSGPCEVPHADTHDS